MKRHVAHSGEFHQKLFTSLTGGIYKLAAMTVTQKGFVSFVEFETPDIQVGIFVFVVSFLSVIIMTCSEFKKH